MNRIPIEPGRVVVSKAGRDEGRKFIVIQEIDQDFVWVADGGLRGMDRPKKKRRKHLHPTPVRVEAFLDRMEKGEPVKDHELRNWITEEEG